nr:MAG TPA: hypothetical protein [Caudoviricetes sp.]
MSFVIIDGIIWAKGAYNILDSNKNPFETAS